MLVLEIFSISSFESLKLRLSMKLILIQIEKALETELISIVDIYRASKQHPQPETYHILSSLQYIKL